VKAWAKEITAVTLFAEDLAKAKAFYKDIFGLSPIFENEDSAAFRNGETVINLLHTASAPELIAPAPVAAPEAGARFQFTVIVDDVDALAAELQRHGVALLNGPMDRWWGMRTASFRDPAGHIWEIGYDLPQKPDA
jgi:lactoylglutathione lyase